MSSKNRKLAILLAAAIITALLAGFATYSYLTPKKDDDLYVQFKLFGRGCRGHG